MTFNLRLIRLSQEHIEDGDIFYERNLVFSFKIGIELKRQRVFILTLRYRYLHVVNKMTIWCRKNSSFTADIIRQHHKILSQKGKHSPKVEMYFFLQCKFSCNLWKSLSINHYKDVLSLRKLHPIIICFVPY